MHPVLIWPGRQPAVFHPDKVKVDNGRVSIEVGKLPEPMEVYKYGRYITYEYYGGCLRGFTPARPGQYYECEAKMNKTEMGGGFWLAGRSPCGTVHEIDITESVGIITSQTADWAKDWDYIMHSNAFYKKADCSDQIQIGNKINLPTKNHERFYRYGFWWKSSEELLFYVNGEYAYSIILPANADQELYLQYDIEAYDWNPFPSDGGKVTNGSLEERTTQLNYIHTFKLLDAMDPGHQAPEVFNIYTEELTLNDKLTELTSGKKLTIPLTYKANEDREIHLKLLNPQGELVGEDLIPAYAGYSNLAYGFYLDSVPAAGPGYTLYADIRPVNSPISDTIMSDNISLELRKPSVVTIQVMDEKSNNPLDNVSVYLNDSIKLSDAEGLAVFYNISVNDYKLELAKDGYSTIRDEKLQTRVDTLIIKHLSLEHYSLLISFLDVNSNTPIKHAEVSLNNVSQSSGPSGRVLYKIPKGKYELRLIHPNYVYSDSLMVSRKLNEIIRLKKAFSDFYVFVEKDNKAFAYINVTMGDTTIASNSRGSITFPLLRVDSTYQYQVHKESEILIEDSVKITENGILSINISSSSSSQEVHNTPVFIYPNPVQGMLYLSEELKNQEFTIFNSLGVKVKKGSSTQHFLPVKDLPKGVYILRIQGKAIRFVKG